MGGDAEEKMNRWSGDGCDHPSRFDASMPDADRHWHATLIEDPSRHSPRLTTVPTDANAPLVDRRHVRGGEGLTVDLNQA